MTHHVAACCRRSGKTGSTCRSRPCSTAPASAADAAACTANWCAVRKHCRTKISPRIASILAARSSLHPLDDKYHRDRSPVWDKVVTPLFSSANWGGQGLHPRGNFEGYVRAAAKDKWLEAHGIEHWTHFYTDYGREQQLAFLRLFPARQERRLEQTRPKCCCKSATPARNSSNATRMNGRSRAPTGPSSISTRPAWRSAPRSRRPNPRSSTGAMGDGVTLMTPP